MRCLLSCVVGLVGAASVASASPVPVLDVRATSPIDAAPSALAGEGEAMIRAMVRRSVLESLSPMHREIVERRISYTNENGPTKAALCFAPGTSDQVVEAFYAAQGGQTRAQLNSRWSSTSSNGGGLSQGQPTTLRYSFPPDGTTIPNIGVGFAAGTNDFNAFMNGIYGSPAVWQGIFDEVFARWGDLCGITYIREFNDDGADLHNNGGLVGVRGDLRVAGMFLDGNSNVLAYNNFPNDGDMVFDTGDNFYSVTSSDSLRLRNVAFHEHGHGMGLLHVCPVNGSKLMEPFINTGFFGPQHDDVRGAQRHYGDPFEPDNTVAQANPLGSVSVISPVSLGSVPAPGIGDTSILSIDANGEQDYFSFTVSSSASVTVTVSPFGLNYDDSPQQCGGSGNCCSGDFVDSDQVANLGVQIIDSNGATVLGTSTSAPAGTPEQLSGVFLPGAGTYYARVYETNSPTEAQLYEVFISIESVPLTIQVISSLPSELEPGVPITFDVQANPGNETVVPGTPMLNYRFDGGAYLSTPLANQGGGFYEATLPGANCGDFAEFYVSAEGSGGTTVEDPPGGGSAPYTATVGTQSVIVQSDFEDNAGFTVSGNAGDGQWTRGVPVGAGDRGDPLSDFDGSGACWLTDNVSGNSDVDGGSTILTSPVYDLTSVDDPSVSYARWYDNTAGAEPQADIFVVEVSDNGGGSWTNLETVGPTVVSQNGQVEGGWFQRSFRIADFVGITSQFQIRFTASDVDPGSVVEAGVDALSIDGVNCTPPLENEIELRVVVANDTGVDANDEGPVTITDAAAGVELYVQARINGDPDATGLTTFDGILDDGGTGVFGQAPLTIQEATGLPFPGDDVDGQAGMFPSYRGTIGLNNGDVGNGELNGGRWLYLPLNIQASGNGQGLNGAWSNIYKLNWSSADPSARTVVIDSGAGLGGYQSTGGLVQPVTVVSDTFSITIDETTPTCPCEVNGDTVVDSLDLLAFLALWFPGDPASDYNNDGTFNSDVLDLLDYLACWFPASSGTPCP